LKTKQRHSTPPMIDEEIKEKDREDLNRSTLNEEKKEETPEESVNVGKVIAELNHRMANVKNSPFHRSQTSNNSATTPSSSSSSSATATATTTTTTAATTTNRRYSSSFRNTIHQSSPGETTDF